MLSLPVETVPGEADESYDPGWTPERIVEELSLRKCLAARAGAGGKARRIVVGSDTIVVLDGDVLGKPRDAGEAKTMLSRLQGREHAVYTGLALVDAESAGFLREAGENPGGTAGGARGEPGVAFGIGSYRKIFRTSPGAGVAAGRPAAIVGHTASKVVFRPMSESEIDAYVESGEPLDKAGAYGVQGIGSVFIEKIDGDFYSVMGLPIHLLYRMLQEYGVSPFRRH